MQKAKKSLVKSIEGGFNDERKTTRNRRIGKKITTKRT
jgi:hypothetical protein